MYSNGDHIKKSSLNILDIIPIKEAFTVKSISGLIKRKGIALTHDQIRGRISYLVVNGYVTRVDGYKYIYIRKENSKTTQTPTESQTSIMTVLPIQELKAQAEYYGLILCKETVKIEKV